MHKIFKLILIIVHFAEKNKQTFYLKHILREISKDKKIMSHTRKKVP